MRGQQPARLVIEEQPRALARAQRVAVDGNPIRGLNVERRRGDHDIVDRDTPGLDPRLGFPPRAQAGARDRLGDALALPRLGVGLARHDHRFVMAGLVRVVPAIHVFGAARV